MNAIKLFPAIAAGALLLGGCEHTYAGTGALAGGAAGAVIGAASGDVVGGAVIGAAAGAVGGSMIHRNSHCYRHDDQGQEYEVHC